MNPKIIVLEGIDGSGKTTQFELLKAYFRKEGINFASFDFPQYEKTAGGWLLNKLLWRNPKRKKTNQDRRLFPDAQIISPYLISLAYAVDRAAVAPLIQKALNQGKFVLLNRYWTSNLGHQGAKLKTITEKRAFVRWLTKLEIEDLEVPQEDIVFFLDISTQTQKQLLQNRQRDQDTVESDLDYQERCLENYRWLVQEMDHWIRILTETPSGKIRSPDSIHNEIISTLKKHHII